MLSSCGDECKNIEKKREFDVLFHSVVILFDAVWIKPAKVCQSVANEVVSFVQS